MSDWNSKIIEEFRENDGKVGGSFGGAPMLLLHTKGRKSGQPRVNPMVYYPVGDNFAVFASRGGTPENPDWYYNAVANGDASVEIGNDTIDVHVRELTGAEREPIWTDQKKRMPGFAEYEEKTKGIREIPVLLLERR